LLVGWQIDTFKADSFVFSKKLFFSDTFKATEQGFQSKGKLQETAMAAVSRRKVQRLFVFKELNHKLMNYHSNASFVTLSSLLFRLLATSFGLIIKFKVLELQNL
jgi:hypothetical protein